MKLNRLILSVLALTVSMAMYAGRDFYHFNDIDVQPGITSPVTSICAQRESFVWAGTEDGIIRLSSGQSRRFATGAVDKVFEDAKSNLWVLTEGNLKKFDDASTSFKTILENALAGCACAGGCYFASSDSLFRYDYHNSDFVTISALNFYASDMCSWSDNFLAVKTIDGMLVVLDKSTGNQVPFPVASEGRVSAIFVDASEHLWVSISGEGVGRYDLGGARSAFFSQATGLSSNFVNAFTECYGKIWLGLDAFGIDVIDPVTSTVEHLSSFKSGSVSSLASSREDIIWIGRPKGGIIQASTSPIFTLPLEFKDGITCAVEDGEIMYLGSESSGLLAYNPSTQAISKVPGTSGFSVLSAARLSSSKLLLYSRGSGTMVFDRVTSSFTPFRPSDTELLALCSRPNHSLHLDNDESDNIYISTDNAVFVYYPGSGKCRSLGLPLEFCPDGALIPVPGRFKSKYFYNAGKIFSLSGDGSSLAELYDAGARISCAAMSSDNVVWLATDAGLQYYNIWTADHGCVSTGVFSTSSLVVCDAVNHIWCGTPSGLFMYDPDNRYFTLFNAADGVDPEPFCGCGRCADGKCVIISGLNNLYVVESGITAAPSLDPVLTLLDLEVVGQTVKASVSQQGSNILRSTTYRFNVSKSGRDSIIDNGTSCVLDIANLMPGRYVLYASCMNRNGNWTEWKKLATFHVEYPYYFWVLIFLCVLLAALATYPLVFKRQPMSQMPPLEIPSAEASAQADGEDRDDASADNDRQAPSAVRSSFMLPSLPFENPSQPVRDISDATLLVVEDDLDLSSYLESEFSSHFKKVFLAGNGVEAVGILNYEDVDIVVSDIMMPQMDGFELCRFIKTHVHLSHIPVILLTARSDADSRMLGYKNGADDYLTKPFDLVVLMNSISNLFLGRELSRQRYASGEHIPSSEETTFSSADEEFMHKFTELVSSHVSDPDLDVKHLVEETGISRSLLFYKVKNLTGLNIQSFVNKVRMEKVIELMTTTYLPLAEIAQKCGFSSPRYFSTAFKNYTGVTPSQYKKENVK